MIPTVTLNNNEAGVGEAVLESVILRNEIFMTTKLQSNRNVTGLIEQSFKKCDGLY